MSSDPHVDMIRSIHAQAQQRIGTHQRLIERFTATLGQPRTIYVLLFVVLVWAVGNTFVAPPAPAGHAWDDPPFLWLQGAVGLYAAIMSTLVLITQTRQQRQAEHRSSLELQVNLTAEQKIAKLIELIEELRRDIPSVANRVDLQAETMAQAVDPQAVLTALGANTAELMVVKEP